MRKPRSRQKNICFNLWKQSPPPIQMHSVLEEKDNPRVVSSHQALMVSFFGKISGPPEYFKKPFDLTSNKHWTDCWLGRGVRYGKCYKRDMGHVLSGQEAVKGESNLVARFYLLAEKAKLHGTAIAEQGPLPLLIYTVYNHQCQGPVTSVTALRVSPPYLQMWNLAAMEGNFITPFYMRLEQLGILVWGGPGTNIPGPQGLLYSPKQRLLFGNLATREQHWLTLALKVPPALHPYPFVF